MSPSRWRLLGRTGSIAVAGLVAACDRAVILHPKGPIADAERGLLFDAFSVMMLVIVPVIVMAFLFAWRYRARGGAAYAPKWDESTKLDAIVWAIPALIVLAVAVLVWRSTHRLDPYKPIASTVAPLEVQVVAQDWKWLFIYPEQGIAVVNQMAIPSGRPVSLRITSDTVMNSFYVPALAGQIYAMAGMDRTHGLGGAPDGGLAQLGGVGIAGRLVGDRAQAESLGGVVSGRLQPPVVEGKTLRLAVFEEKLPVIGPVERIVHDALHPVPVHSRLREKQLVVAGHPAGLRLGSPRQRYIGGIWR